MGRAVPQPQDQKAPVHVDHRRNCVARLKPRPIPIYLWSNQSRSASIKLSRLQPRPPRLSATVIVRPCPFPLPSRASLRPSRQDLSPPLSPPLVSASKRVSSKEGHQEEEEEEEDEEHVTSTNIY